MRTYIRQLVAAVLSSWLLLAWLPAAHAAQGTGCVPTTGTVSGLTFAQDINAAIAALISSNSGASAPATDCTAVAIKGQVWLDTSATPNILKQYDGTSWLVIGFIDTTSHVWTPPIGGGAAAIASASTTDLWSLPQSSLTISGTTGITALASSSAVPGTLKIVRFASVLTLTYNATSLILPAAVDITTAAGDYALVTALTSTNVAVVSYFRADGSAVVNPSIPVAGQLNYFGATPPAKFARGNGAPLTRTSYQDYLAAVTVTQNVTRVSGNATLTGYTDTTVMGAGQPLEGTGIPAGATIASVTSTSVTMASTCGAGSSPCQASSSGTGNVTAFLYGYGAGGNTSTVGLPDCQSRMILSRDGNASGRVTTAGSGINATQLGATGGAQSRSITQPELPNVSPTWSGSFSGNSMTASISALNGALINTGVHMQSGASAFGGNDAGAPSTDAFTPTGSVSGTISALGSGTAHPHMNPVIVADCIIRVLP